MVQKEVVALFDFDGTITRRDSLLPFLWYLFGPLKLFAYGLLLSPVLLAYITRLMPNGVAKEKILGRMLAGRELIGLKEKSKTFALTALPSLIRPESAERIAWHQSRGHRVIIVSASPELYLRPWAESLGIKEVLATRLRQDGERVLFGFDGVNCFGEEKAQRVRDYLGDMSNTEFYAYGDSRGDQQMLAMADHAYYRGEPMVR